MKTVLDYTIHDPRGWCGDPRRGAALGRPVVKKKPQDAAVKLYLRRKRLDGDYDENGTYFGGGGPPLYWCVSADHEVDFMLRAQNRDAAKDQVRESYPNAKFFN